MGIKSIIHKTKHGCSGAIKGMKDGLDQANKQLACMQAINNVRNDVQGHDPRTWMMACAKETLFKLGGPNDFKKCLLGKVKKEVKDISDPEAYVESLWDMIKDKCPTC
jgi:hypothetical protein